MLAAKLNVLPATIYKKLYNTRKKIREGGKLLLTDLPLPSTRVGNSPHWDSEEIEKWIGNLPASPRRRVTR